MEMWDQLWLPLVTIAGLGVAILAWVGPKMRERKTDQDARRDRLVEIVTLSSEVTALAESIKAAIEAAEMLAHQNAVLTNGLGGSRHQVARDALIKYVEELSLLTVEAVKLVAGGPEAMAGAPDHTIVGTVAGLKVALKKMQGLRARATNYIAMIERDNDHYRSLLVDKSPRP